MGDAPASVLSALGERVLYGVQADDSGRGGGGLKNKGCARLFDLVKQD